MHKICAFHSAFCQKIAGWVQECIDNMRFNSYNQEVDRKWVNVIVNRSLLFIFGIFIVTQLRGCIGRGGDKDVYYNNQEAPDTL